MTFLSTFGIVPSRRGKVLAPRELAISNLTLVVPQRQSKRSCRPARRLPKRVYAIALPGGDPADGQFVLPSPISPKIFLI
jgi:hypothetical protein